MRALFRLVAFLLIVGLVLGGLAIWMASRYVDVDIQDGKAVATLTMPEEDLNKIVRWSVVEGGPHQAVLEDITRIDIREGAIRVEGAYTAPDGSRKLGWVDLSLQARGGGIVPQIVDIDREGFERGGEALSLLNEHLAQEMARSRDSNHARITDVKIGDERVVIRAETR